MADKKVDLRFKNKRLSGGAPVPKTVDTPGFKGTLPFAAKVMTKSNSTELPTEVREEAERYEKASMEIPEHIKRQAITPPTPIDIDDLSPEKLEEIKEVLRDVDKKPTRSQPFIPRGPGIAEAKALADKVAREAAQGKPAVKAAPKEPELEPEVKKEPVTPIVTADSLCVHCGWPIGNSDDTEPTKADKQMFVAAVLGQKRYIKEFSLFGGQLRVAFRTLRTEEIDMVIKQLTKDWNDGKLSGPAQSVAEATRYQMILALDAVETNIGLVKQPTLEEYDYDPKDIPTGGTVLPQIVEHITNEVLTMEPLRRAVAKAYGHFLDTTSKLEAMAETSSFWEATVD